MAQAIQSFFSPAGLGVKPGGAADLFSSDEKSQVFSDVLAGESSRGAGRDAAKPTEPVGRAERAGADVDRDAASRDAGAAETDVDPAEPSDAAVSEGVSTDERERSREDAAQVETREADTAVAEDVPADEDAAAQADQGLAIEGALANAHAAEPVAGAVAAVASPVETSAAVEAGHAGPLVQNDRSAQAAVDARRGEARSAKLAAQPGVASESLINAPLDTANPVAPTSAAAPTVNQDAETTPLVLQPAAPGANSATAGDAAPATPAATAATPGATYAQPIADAAPGPIPVQGANLSAGAQLAEAHTARSDENASLNNARLARGLASAVNQKGGAVTLRLTPPEMGTVRIQMQITGTTLAASFHAETASAHALLSQQLGQLRTSLETQGLHVERLSVQPMQQTQQGGSANNQGDDAQQNHQPNDGRSRGQGDRGNSEQRGGRRGDEQPRDGAQQPATFDEHLGSAPAERNA